MNVGEQQGGTETVQVHKNYIWQQDILYTCYMRDTVCACRAMSQDILLKIHVYVQEMCAGNCMQGGSRITACMITHVAIARKHETVS